VGVYFVQGGVDNSLFIVFIKLPEGVHSSEKV
jgi:hypothetical protein